MPTAKAVIIPIAAALGAFAAGLLVRDALGGKSWIRSRNSANSAQITFMVYLAEDMRPPDPATKPLPPEEERANFINSTMKLMRMTEFLDQVFQNREVLDSVWYKSFRSQAEARAALDAAMESERTPNTSLFQVSLQIEPRTECDIILNKVGDQFITWRESIDARQREIDIKPYRDQVQAAEKTLLRAQTEADDFRAIHDMSSPQKSLELANSVLLDLERELSRLVTEQKILQSQVDKVTAAQNDSNYKIPVELVEQIEREPSYRALNDLGLTLERAREVTTREKSDTPESKKIAAELEVTKKQLQECYDKLAGRAKEKQLSSMNAALSEINGRILDVKKKHDEKQAEIRRLDGELTYYRVREDTVNAARAQFNAAQVEFNKMDAVLRSRMARVQFIGRAKPVSP